MMRKEWKFKNNKYQLAIELNWKKGTTNALGYLIKDDKYVLWFGVLIFRVEFEILRNEQESA